MTEENHRNVTQSDEVTPTARDNSVANAVLEACKRAISKGRSLDGLNVDAIVWGAVQEYRTQPNQKAASPSMQMYVARENPHFNADDVRAVAALRSSLIQKRVDESPSLGM